MPQLPVYVVTQDVTKPASITYLRPDLPGYEQLSRGSIVKTTDLSMGSSAVADSFWGLFCEVLIGAGKKCTWKVF